MIYRCNVSKINAIGNNDFILNDEMLDMIEDHQGIFRIESDDKSDVEEKLRKLITDRINAKFIFNKDEWYIKDIKYDTI